MTKEKIEEYLLKTKFEDVGNLVEDYFLELAGKVSTLKITLSPNYNYIEDSAIKFDIDSFYLDNAERIKELLAEDIDMFNTAYEDLANFLRGKEAKWENI